MLGRNWPLNEPLGPGEVYLSSQLATALKVKVGSTIYGRFNASFGGRSLYNETVMQYSCSACSKGNETAITKAEMVWAPHVVKGIFSEFYGKFQRNSETFVVLVGMDSLLPHLSTHLNPTLLPRSAELARNFTKVDLNHFVSSVAVNLPAPRIEAYLTSSYQVVHDRLITFSNRVIFKLGIAQVGVDMPVLRGLAGTEMVSLFLGLILNVIIFILLFLSIVLIYSLLMISVETRTFEMGILRMIGMTRPSLVSMLLVQAFAYALPAWIIGMLCALAAYAGAAGIVGSITGAAVPKVITSAGFGLSTLIGFLVPIAASILPIRAALGKNLQDSLDVRHNKTKAVEINLKRGEDALGVSSWTHLMIGIGLSFFGAVIYYVLPQGLLSMNFALLMNMFLFILIGMLLGLVMVALNLQHLLERALGWLFFFWESRGIRNLVVKNLVAHRKRNQKTSILYALSLGFIIFINIAYSIQVSSISEQKQRDAGATMLAQGWGNMDPASGYIPALYNYELERVRLAFPDVVDDIAWVTKTLRDAYANAVNVRVMNIGRWNVDIQYVYGVSPNFLRVANSDYIIVGKALNSEMDATYLVDRLYSREGSGRALFGSSYMSYIGVGPNDTLLLSSDSTVGTSSTSDDDSSGGSSSSSTSNSGLGSGGLTGGTTTAAANVQTTRQFLASGEAFLDSMPHFVFSAFPLRKNQDMIVSLPTFNAMSGFQWTSVTEMPMSAMLVKFKNGVSNVQIDRVRDWLQARLSGSQQRVWDYREQMEPFEVANRAISYFFTFTTVVAMAISFFSLMSSMYTNIREQTKEIGVIRALGIPKSWVYRIYIYEAFLLVVASSLLGIIIGTVTSYTMNSQQSLFTQLPLAFKFPFILLATVLTCSVLFALLSSWSPIKVVLNNRIVSILRGL